ncbi:helix-turn-helix transcriptional regulator [Marinibaculum pumilum]|uniref:Helix-turn-helix transcriptional regulator n=1 Tax=Marinibaculum pumilum TaxID=1766165 RepID=A0ABV7L7X8_9PROT
MSAGDRILFLLKTRGPATAADLAARLSVSPQAVREQLAALAREGLVGHADIAAGRGRPKRHWHLAEAAVGRFPDTHAELTVELITAIREELGEAALDRLVKRRTQRTTAGYRAALAACPGLQDKVAALAALRSAEGYMAEAQPDPDGPGMLLIENHCPICAAATACQGFCRAELESFRSALGPGVRVERLEHIPAGARRCAYRITEAG